MTFPPITEDDVSFNLPVFQGPTVPQAFWGSEYVEQEDSGFGSSYHSVLMVCPRKFFFSNVERLRPSSYGEQGVTTRNRSLLRGWLMHACCEVYYGGGLAGIPMSQESKQETFDRLNAVAQVRGYEDLIAEVETLWSGYLDRYEAHDRLTYDVCAVEHPLHVHEVTDGEEFIYTIRADLMVRHKVNDIFYIVEHKNLSSYGDNERKGYLLDLQVQGEAYTFTRNFPTSAFGGVIVNVTVCTKTPSFYRQTVTFTERRLRNFGKTVRGWAAKRAQEQQAGWLQNFASCKHRFPGSHGGLCDYHDLCTNMIEVEDIRGKDPPIGFVRKEKLVRKADLVPVGGEK